MEIRAACHAQSDGLCYTWNHAEWVLNINTCLFVLSKKHFLWRLVNSGSTSQHYHVKFFCLLNWMLVTSDDRVPLEHSLAYYCTPLPPHNGHFLLSPRWSLWRGSTVLLPSHSWPQHLWGTCYNVPSSSSLHCITSCLKTQWYTVANKLNK